MKLLILTLLILVSCAKSGKHNNKVEEVVDSAPTEEVVEPLAIGEFEEEIKNTVINTARKVLFSETLKDITRVKLEVENIFKVETSYKTVTHNKKYCWHNAAPQNCSGLWCIQIYIYCTDTATYNASSVKGILGGVGAFQNPNKKLSVSYRTLNAWAEKKFKDDVVSLFNL